MVEGQTNKQKHQTMQLLCNVRSVYHSSVCNLRPPILSDLLHRSTILHPFPGKVPTAV